MLPWKGNIHDKFNDNVVGLKYKAKIPKSGADCGLQLILILSGEAGDPSIISAACLKPTFHVTPLKPFEMRNQFTERNIVSHCR